MYVFLSCLSKELGSVLIKKKRNVIQVTHLAHEAGGTILSLSKRSSLSLSKDSTKFQMYIYVIKIYVTKYLYLLEKCKRKIIILGTPFLLYFVLIQHL